MKLIKTGAVLLLLAALLLTGMPAAFADALPMVQTLKPTHMYVYYAGSYSYPGGDMSLPGRWTTEDVRARLQGSVNPGGGNCTVYFEYGTTTAYGSTASAGTVSGTSAVSVSAALTGLRAATLYHYRLVAVSDSGIVYGHDLAFIPSCDSYEIYCLKDLNPEHDVLKYWNARFIPSADPTGNIEIVASPAGVQSMATFDIENHNTFDVTLYYSDGETSGSVIIGSVQTQSIYVPKNSICSFYYNYSIFKQVQTNDQDFAYNETPLLKNKVEMYFLGSLANRQAGMYSINNRNAQEVTLDLQTGSNIYTVTVPAGSNVYFLAPSGYEVMASMHDDPENPFMVVSPAVMKWHGAALVTAEPQGHSDTAAAFRLQNNDDTAHSVKLKNADGVTRAYTLAPYEHKTVTIEKSNWDVYMQLSPLPQPNIAGWVEDGYVKINSASPGAAVLPPLTVSGATVFMGAYGSSDSSLYVTGGGDWTAVSDQPWLTVSPAAGNGFSWLTMTASVNTSSSSRSAVVTVSDGTTTKAVTVTQTGQGRGNALSFDGADDYVSVPDNDDGITDAVTIETWVKWEPGAPTDIQFICGKGIEQMEIHTGGSANSLRFIPTPGVYLDAEGVLSTGVWTHVAAVYQPSSSLAKLYINGNEVTLTNHGPNPVTAALASTGSGFSIGRRGDSSYRFKGALDDFCVWNRALTQNEIRLNMVNPVIPSAQTGLVSAYSFNQGVAGGDNSGVTVLTDETGYRSGSLSGFALNGASSNWVASSAGEGLASYTVTYDPNGATSGTVPSDPLRYVTGAKATVKAAGDLAKTGSSFGGWNTAADGSGTTYAAGTLLTMSASNVTLYARWTANQTSGTISGTVTDGTNPIMGANVSLTVSGSVYSATTVADGSYSILNVPAGTGYTVTAGKSGYTSGSVSNISVTANATTQNINIALTSDQEGCLVTYKGAQKRYNAGSNTYDIRFIAIINTLNAKEVGFVFSKSQLIPTRENAAVKATTTVYTSITAAGSTVTAASLAGTHIIACTVTGIPVSDIDVPLHVRAFSTVGTVTKYTPAATVTVNSLP